MTPEGKVNMMEYLLRNNRKLKCTKASITLKTGGGRTVASNDASQPVGVMVRDDMLYIHADAMSDDAVVKNKLDSRVATYAYPLDNIAEFEFVLAKDFDKDLLLLRQIRKHEDEQARKHEDEQASKEGTDTLDGPAEPIRQELAKPLRWWRKLIGRE